MYEIRCPHCGPRAQAEFTYERTLDSIARPGEASDAAMTTLFTRANPKGADWELWRHSFGCRAWMELHRHRVTHEILEVRARGPEALP